ncbi:hypothetical protein Tco_0241922 [Tanacetum coccineum]
MLLWHGTGDSGPDMSFDISASPEYMSGLGHTSLAKADLGTLIKTYHIPLDLHPHLPNPDLTMDHLPNDVIGIYTQSLRFFGLRLNKVVSFEIVCRDLGIIPSVNLFRGFQSLYKQDHRVNPDYLTWRNSHSCISDDLFTDGFDQNDVSQLCAHLIRLREINELVFVRSGLSSAWFNQVLRRTDDDSKMSIYDFMTLPMWENAKVVEEPHDFTSSILQRVQNNTTAPAAEGTPIPLPTPDEVAAGQPDPRLAKNPKALAKRKTYTSLIGPSEPNQPKCLGCGGGCGYGGCDLSVADYCTFLRIAWRGTKVPLPRLFLLPLRFGKRLGSPPPPRLYHDASSNPSHVGTSNAAHASSFGHGIVQEGVVVVGSSGKYGANVIRRQLDPLYLLARGALARDQKYDQIMEDDFATASLGEEIDLTLFPLEPGPYVMPYPFDDGEGSSSSGYTRQEWDEPHALKANVLSKEIFKDPDVFRRALDRTLLLRSLRELSLCFR